MIIYIVYICYVEVRFIYNVIIDVFELFDKKNCYLNEMVCIIFWMGRGVKLLGNLIM